MLMVIFGAGASYDSCFSFPPRGVGHFKRDRDGRLPLAKQLFYPESRFRVISAKYRKCQFLFPELEHSENIEGALAVLRDEATVDFERRRQLFALQYYIRDVIAECQGLWLTDTAGVLNHQKVFDYARRFETVALVTFNYDTLIEYSLHGLGIRFPTIDSYVAGTKWKLFKLHGSIDWVGQTAVEISRSLNTSVLIERSHEFYDLDYTCIRQKSARRDPENPQAELPALAIPTNNKSRFVCSPDHVSVLQEVIPRVTRILTVGWRGTEAHFVKILKRCGLRPETEWLIVCEETEAAKATVVNLGTVPGRMRVSNSGGFSRFIRSDEIKEFLRP